jgi:hypothetical protein
VHWDDRGNELIAGRITRALAATGLLVSKTDH